MKKWLTFTNPEYLERMKKGRSLWGIPQYIEGMVATQTELIMPRGFTPNAIAILKSKGASFSIVDSHVALDPVDIKFLGKPRDYQEAAIKELFKRRFGTLESLPGSGKTFMGIYLASLRRQPTTIIVHTKTLFKQWLEAITKLTDVPLKEIGIFIGTRKKRVGPRFTVAMVKTALNHIDMLVPHTGFLIVDECHRTPSFTFTECVTAFQSKFMLGLSATQWRRDGLGRLIFWYLGDKIHQTDEQQLIEDGHVLEAEVIWRDTKFTTELDASSNYAKVLKELTEDDDRNIMIANDVRRELTQSRGIALVLSDRRSHCQALLELLKDLNPQLMLGGIGVRARDRAMDALLTGESRVLIATSTLLGEGFDLPAIHSLFLTTPIRFDGRLIQYLGRALRPAENKTKGRVYDYRDILVGVLEHSANKRAEVYARKEKANGGLYGSDA
jgi:superfamily II DNA or RNA helicase